MDMLTEWADAIFHWLQELGSVGIMLGLMIEVIPSEIVLSYAGYLVHEGAITFWSAVLFGTIGGVAAQLFIYLAGRYGGRPFLERYGKYVLIRRHHLDMAERWFHRYGTGMIFTARFVPVVRHAISIPAGMARMSLMKFTLLTTLAVIPWSVLFIVLGMQLGQNWQRIDEMAEPFVVPFIVLSLLLTLVYFMMKRRQGSRTHHQPVRRKAKRQKGRKAPSSRRAAPARYGEGDASQYGAEGERLTAHQLKYIGSDYTVLHNRVVQGGGGRQQIDHLVVGPNGVFHIETKHWAGDIRFTAGGVDRSRQSYEQDPTAQLYRHEYVIKELLRANGMKAAVTGVICFSHPQCRVEGSSPAFVTVKLDRLVHKIRRRGARERLSRKEITSIVRLLRQHSVSGRA